ncbi:interleukin-15 receptor subunit alpha isoform X2 [Puntigrus tetrazona]|uniref:interleukin-15 receptor subunit alpha isoform X2 n=1 Tax=Puntigrus tetrazona TaxID=1606681 RepID=UPI001C894D7C|nr:interleukin-15 receptor subunit alpha isoform X2 [Puntigrus tetrazona]
MDMHALVNFIFITAACAHIARASDGCGKPEVGENTVPVTELSHNLGARVRIQCVEGYLRKAGTSNLIRCVMQPNGSAAWHSDLPLKCIRDPRITHATTSDPKIVTTTDPPHVTTTETQSPRQQFTLCTTETTAKKRLTLQGTNSPNTAGHIALTTTNEVVATKTRRTTTQPTLMSTTKETESITTNETTSNYTSREYMTTTSSHTLSGSFTTTTGTNAVAALSHGFTPTVSGVTVTVLIILVTAVLICLWLRWRNHRNQNVYNSTPDPSASYIPVSVIGSELSSAQSNRTAENATEGSVVYKNPGTPQEVDACDKLLPQTDT